MYDNAKFLPAGDRALVVEYSDKIEPETNEKIRGLNLAIFKERVRGIIETVPTYRSLMIIYDPLEISCNDLTKRVEDIDGKLGSMALPEARVIEIPTLYGGEYGPDIEFVSKHNDISVDEVIKVHTSGEYLIYMLGFTPGFPYLGGMPVSIATPRLQSPRTKIPAGSVGIAGSQTGIYPIESPGGWQLIGRTPVKLYDPYREEPILLSAGDYLKFTSIDEEEYNRISELEAQGKYRVKISARDGR